MLDHVTIRSGDLEGTKAFLETILGLEVGYRPAFSFPGYWLYADGGRSCTSFRAQAVRSTAPARRSIMSPFALTTMRRCGASSERLSIAYSQMDLPELGERRLFIRTPGGIVLELVFRDRSAELLASTSKEHVHAK